MNSAKNSGNVWMASKEVSGKTVKTLFLENVLFTLLVKLAAVFGSVHFLRKCVVCLNWSNLIFVIFFIFLTRTLFAFVL